MSNNSEEKTEKTEKIEDKTEKQSSSSTSTEPTSTSSTTANTEKEKEKPKSSESAPAATPLQQNNKGGKTTEDYMKGGKVIVLFKATGNAPQLKQSKFKLQCTARFQNVTDFLRKQLHYGANDALFLFINCTFQPSPDETIEDLFRCFHNNGKLAINYATTAAWG